MQDCVICGGFCPSKESELSQRLGLRLVNDAGDRLHLCYTDKGLTLRCGQNCMTGDFADLKKRLKQPNLQSEMIVKASKIKGSDNLRLLDATAGMGTDSFLLAAAGFTVDMYEYDAVIAELLTDALSRAALDPDLTAIVGRITVHRNDSIKAMLSLDYRPDVILLDPMFPERQKSALVKKKFQLLQQLECPCTDENELLTAAIGAKPRRIVIKRPLKAPYLAEKKPSFSLLGKAIRYDAIVFADN